MPFIAIGDARLYYEAQGQGPTMIFLHNATGSTRDWRRVTPQLVAEGYRVIAYDRRGFGRSDPLPQPDWPLDYLRASRDELMAFMDALKLDQVILAGHSDGATIALLAAAAQPQRIRAVIAESPHMWYVPETLIPAFEDFEKTLGGDPRFWQAMHRAHGNRAEEVVRRWRKRWADPAFFSWDERFALEEVVCPVLVMHGCRDPFFPLAHSKEIVALLSEAWLMVFEDAGHVIHGAIVNGYAQAIIRFLNAHAPSLKQMR